MLRAALLGLVLLAVPGLLGAALWPAPEPPVRAWPQSPEGGLAEPVAPARWDTPANESLAMLRRVTVTEARRQGSALAACEARAGRVAEAERTKAFRRCALVPLTRVDGMGTANSRMLSNLAGTAGPTQECRGRVMSLSGMTGALGFSARSTLRGWGISWEETLEASRAIRAAAREAAKLARAPGWSATCPVLPPAEVERPTA